MAKKPIRKILLLVCFFLLFQFPAEATHIVGGDITVKSLGSNDFEITLTLFFDCINGNPTAFDPMTNIGIFDKVTNVMQQSVSLPFVDSLVLPLGDSCYTPANLCVRKQRYIDTVSIPNNPNGYYMSWHRCCRNGIITNMNAPSGSGNVFYVEIPDPARANSTPTFSVYPDAYMCQNIFNTDTFAATDIDGDSLVYSFSVPFDCSANGICSNINPNPGAAPAPYSTIPWQPPYSPANIMGDPAMAVGSSTGIITTTPPDLGVFIFCVKVEEYNRNSKVKLGEIRREVQYAVLPCIVPTVAISGANLICLGQNTTLTAAGGQNYIWNTGATTLSIVVSPTTTGTYTFSVVTTVNSTCHISADTSVTVNPLPVIAVLGNTTICSGYSTPLGATGAGAYSWIPSGSLNNSNISNPVATPPVTTAYVVTGTDASGCTNTATVIVTTANGPTATAWNDTTISLGGSATLHASGGGTYSWSNGENGSSITVTPPLTTVYCVTVTDSNNCTHTACVTVTVEPIDCSADLYLPNAFSPNNDGENDMLRIYYGNLKCINIFNLVIYNRWGEKVFTTNDPSSQWDGSYKSKIEGTAVFVYYMKVILINGEEIIKKGNISLLR